MLANQGLIHSMVAHKQYSDEWLVHIYLLYEILSSINPTELLLIIDLYDSCSSLTEYLAYACILKPSPQHFLSLSLFRSLSLSAILTGLGTLVIFPPWVSFGLIERGQSVLVGEAGVWSRNCSRQSKTGAPIKQHGSPPRSSAHPYAWVSLTPGTHRHRHQTGLTAGAMHLPVLCAPRFYANSPR